MACVEIQRRILPCNPGEDSGPGPKEKPPGLLPPSRHTLLWSCDCLWCGFMWTVYSISRHSNKDLYSSGNILASSLPRVSSSSWWDGGVALLLGSCLEQARRRRGSSPDGGRRPRDDDGLQAQRNSASPQPEKRICENGHGGWVHLSSLLRLWRDRVCLEDWFVNPSTSSDTSNHGPIGR